MLSTKRDLGRGHLWLIGALRRSWSKAARADDPERRVTECEDPEAAVLTMRCRRRLATRNRRSKLAARLAGFSATRSEEHTSELQSLMRISYAVFCLKKKKKKKKQIHTEKQHKTLYTQTNKTYNHTHTYTR